MSKAVLATRVEHQLWDIRWWDTNHDIAYEKVVVAGLTETAEEVMAAVRESYRDQKIHFTCVKTHGGGISVTKHEARDEQ